MITKVIDDKLINQVKSLLDKNDKIVILTHVSPDGDAIGSTLGLYHYLTDMGNEVMVIVPNAFPSFLGWLNGAKDILIHEKYPEYAQKLISEAQLIFCLDFNCTKRTAKVGPLIENAKGKKIMIDHHPDPDNFCNVTISYPQISSTSELIFHLICRFGDYDVMSKACAEAIYTGMMTDTGAFTYNSNNAQIYSIIAELLKKGIDKDQIYSNVYNNYSEDRYRMLGYVLSEKMKIYKEYNAALIWLTKAEQKQFHAQKGDTEGFSNLPLNISGIIFAVFLREDNEMIKISLRSKGNFPCNKFAGECFNGGGHLNASGGEFYGTLDEAKAIFENALPKYKELLSNMKKNNIKIRI